MGLFIQLGGIFASEAMVTKAIAALKNQHPNALENIDFYSESDDRVLVFFDDSAQDAKEALASISEHLGCPCLWFHIHDDSLWMYHLYMNGIEIDRFNTHPGYWSEVTAGDRKSWAGSAAKLAEVWSGVKESEVDRYLVDHEADGFNGEAKAYETDQFEAWDCWQLVDFTAKLGLPYPPEDEEG